VVRKVTRSGAITTVAGTGAPGYSGDGGPATAALLSNPAGVAVDGAGDLFIADTGNAVVRKVAPGGVITTVAGLGRYGSADGDGGPATAAALNNPAGVAVDAAGDLFILETFGNRVRKVTPDGIITTVAGTGTAGYSGDGGPATAAALNSPDGIAANAAGDLFIADTNNNVVREVKPGGVITTVAGSGAYGYGGGEGDGGPATAAALNNPAGVAADAAGDLFILNAGTGAIREVRPDGIIATVIGTGGQSAATRLSNPSGVAVDGSGDLFIADTFNNEIRRVTVALTVTVSAPPVPDDFDGLGKSEFGLYDPVAARFAYIASGTGAAVVSPVFGYPADHPIPLTGHFDGGGKAELGIYDPVAARFAYIASATGAAVVVPRAFGFPADHPIPLVGDFDGLGKSEFAIYDPVAARFAYISSATGAAVVVPQAFGFPADHPIPLVGDFDGKGMDEFAIYDPVAARFAYIASGTGAAVVAPQAFGFPADHPIPLGTTVHANPLASAAVRVDASTSAAAAVPATVIPDAPADPTTPGARRRKLAGWFA